MKKSISFILVMLMVLCMIPGVAMADSYVAETGGTKYSSIQAAVDAAANGATVKLLSDVTLTEANRATSDPYNVLIYVNDNKNITLDMNGKTIKVVHTDAFNESDYLVSVICVGINAGLTVTGNGKIDVDAHDTNPDIAYTFFKRGSTGYLTIENGSYHMDNSGDSIIYTSGSDVVTVNGGTFHLGNVGTGENRSPWIFNVRGQNEGHVNVNGGTFNDKINNQFWIFEAQMPANKALIDNGDGTWTVVDAVAYVNAREWSGAWYTYEVGYTTLADAVNAVRPNRQKTSGGKTYDSGTEDVGLVTDCPINTTLMVNESFELIPNGKTIIWEGDDTDPMFTVKEGKTLTLPHNFTPKRNGYVFQGLFTDVNRTIPYVPAAAGNATRSTGDISIYAKWSVDESNPSASPEITPAPKSSGSGISVKYNGGNSFSTSKSDVPTGVEIDGVEVPFTGNGSSFTVGCIDPNAKWVTVKWNSTSVTTNFTPDGLVECSVSIPKTGDVSIWAAIAQFLGF